MKPETTRATEMPRSGKRLDSHLNDFEGLSTKVPVAASTGPVPSI